MPLSRFDRNFELIVQVSDNLAVEVKPPIRVAFSSNKSVAGGLNQMTLRVYNLNQSNRLALVKNPEEIKYIGISFSVGYQDNLHLLFKGSVHRGENFREGADMITELECLDGGYDYLNSFTSRTVKGKTKALTALLSDLPNTEKGKVTEQSALLRPKVLVGQTMQLIDSLINEGESWYVDDEKLYILKDDEVVSSFIPVVDASTGLLNTPSRENYRVTFETLMNPSLKIGGLCNLVSVSAPHLNGVYKIDSMSYNGDNYGSDWVQSVTGLLAGNYRVI